MHWAQYQQKFLQEWKPNGVCYLEKMLFVSLIVMTCICSVEAYVGHDVGNVDEIRLAKLKAQEELMAVRPAQ